MKLVEDFLRTPVDPRRIPSARADHGSRLAEQLRLVAVETDFPRAVAVCARDARSGGRRPLQLRGKYPAGALASNVTCVTAQDT